MATDHRVIRERQESTHGGPSRAAVESVVQAHSRPDAGFSASLQARMSSPVGRKRLRRREFVTLASAAVIWPLALSAQVKPTPVIGILNPDVGLGFIFDAFVEGMRDLGYVDGKNITYVRKEVQGPPDSIPSLAAELVELKVDVIVTVAPRPTRAVGRATTTFSSTNSATSDGMESGRPCTSLRT